MVKHDKTLTRRAKEYWERRDLAALDSMRRETAVRKIPEVLYYVGLGLHALNKKREAIECWREAWRLDPRFEDAIRVLAYELLDQAPVEAAELFYNLVGLQRANADDFTCLRFRGDSHQTGSAR